MKRLITILAITTAVIGVKAEEQFLQLSLTPDIALQSRDTFIRGIALNIWGENPQAAFNLGFINGSTGQSGGFSLGLVNYCEDYTGVHFGTVNYAKGEFVGWQNGFLNVSGQFRGLQLGAVNYAESLTGVQIGFINIVQDNPWFDELPNKLAKAFVFVNWSF